MQAIRGMATTDGRRDNGGAKRRQTDADYDLGWEGRTCFSAMAPGRVGVGRRQMLAPEFGVKQDSVKPVAK